MSNKAAAKKRNEKLMATSTNYGSVYLDVNDPGQHWDYAIAFPNPETRKSPAPVSMQEILEKLHEHGLIFKLFYSSTRDMVLCQIRCHYKRLQMEADRIDMPVLLDPKVLQATAERGFPELGIAPFAISDVKRLYDFHPYEHIHAAYEDDEEHQDLFAKRNLDGSVFAPVERMKLIESIIVSHECCNLDLDALCMDGSILACYPLHNEDEIKHLAKSWIPKVAAPWTQPIEEIRDYFGERIAFYFGYLGHYTTWLIYASIVASIVFLIKWFTETEERTIKNPDGTEIKSEVPSVMTYVIPIFAVFMCIWSTLFMESWKRQQQVFAMKWGMTEIEGEESTRPQFTGEPVLSAITGAKTRYFPYTKKYQRVAVSWALLFLLCSVVIAIVAGIFTLRHNLVEGDNAWKAEFLGLKIPVGIAVCSGANVIQIIIMGKIYYRSFYRLNEYENHETDAQYENSLVLKTFVFQFINNFSALIYIAFLKNIFEGPSNTRLHELAYSLAIVYGSQLVIGNVKEILLPRVWVWLSKRSILKQEAVAEHQSEAEKEFFLATYEWSGTFDDFTEIITQFGFCTLFVVAFPLTPVLSLLNNYLEIRVDGYRLLFENRRPRPRNASNIGLWMEIVEFMTTLAILTNAYVVVWTSNTFDFLEVKYAGHSNMVELTRVEAFMIFVAVMLAFRFCIAKLIADVPPSVVAQVKRQLFFNNKAIYRLPDDIVSKYSRRPDDVFDMTIQESG